MKSARLGFLRHMRLVLLAGLLPGAAVQAATTDWGVISLDQPTTMSFASQDITKNFTSYYDFTLSSTATASYAVSVSTAACTSGCGNLKLSYGLYDSSGQLVSDTGSAVLTAGTYELKVKSTGAGSGNSATYSGYVSFTGGSGSSSFVSAVPEPGDIGLMLTGLCMLGAAVRHRRRMAQPLEGAQA